MIVKIKFLGTFFHLQVLRIDTYFNDNLVIVKIKFLGTFLHLQVLPMTVANLSLSPWAFWVFAQTQAILWGYSLTKTTTLAQSNQLGTTPMIRDNVLWLLPMTGSTFLMFTFTTHLMMLIIHPWTPPPTHCPVYMLLALWHLHSSLNSPGYWFTTSFPLGNGFPWFSS